MKSSTVKFFNTTKGFGFITPDDSSNNVFVHINALEKANIYPLNDGQKVSLEVATNKRETSAVHI